MTTESQDAVLGRVVREHGEASRLVAALEAEVSKAQTMYQRLSAALHRSELVRFDDEPDTAEMPQGLTKPDLRFQSVDIDGKRLKLLCANLREARQKQSQLAEQMRKLGA